MRRFLGGAAVALAFPAATVAAQTSAMGWPEVIAALTTERSQAETCVGLLKSRADAATLDKAKAGYGMARPADDGVIAGLEAVLAEGRKPNNLPNVRPSLEDVRQEPQADLRSGGGDRYAEHEGRLGRDCKRRRRGGRRARGR